MTAREKILLALMSAAVAGGGIRFGLSMLPASAEIPQEETLRQARTVADEVSASLRALPLSEGRRYVLASALRPATRNPFTLPESGTPAGEQTPGAPSGLVYAGYVRVGKEALAIIGGLEYGVGDTLPDTGDVIRSIGSDGVRLYSPSRNAEWTLPYTGDDL